MPPDPVSLTDRQRQILDVIRSWVQRHGYPPTVREIGAAVGLDSPSSVAHHLKTLTYHGLIRRAPGGPRAVDARPLVDDEDPPVKSETQHGTRVPLLGSIAAGTPILAEEHVEEVLSLPTELVGRGTLFALRVQGDSMTEAAIADGDIIVVRQQAVADNGDVSSPPCSTGKPPSSSTEPATAASNSSLATRATRYCPAITRRYSAKSSASYTARNPDEYRHNLPSAGP